MFEECSRTPTLSKRENLVNDCLFVGSPSYYFFRVVWSIHKATQEKEEGGARVCEAPARVCICVVTSFFPSEGRAPESRAKKEHKRDMARGSWLPCFGEKATLESKGRKYQDAHPPRSYATICVAPSSPRVARLAILLQPL